MSDAEEIDRREVYEQLLRVVEYNTGGPGDSSPQPLAARKSSVFGICSRAGTPPDALRSAVRAVRDNGDLLQIEDAEGRYRLTRTDTDSLRKVAVWAAEQDPPQKDVVARANRAMA